MFFERNHQNSISTKPIDCSPWIPNFIGFLLKTNEYLNKTEIFFPIQIHKYDHIRMYMYNAYTFK